MSETARIADQLQRAFGGDAWHGPALAELLEGVDGELAAARSLPEVHTIAELVAHLAAWHEAALRAIEGEVLDVSEAENFGAAPKLNASTWGDTQKRLQQAHSALLAAIAKMSDQRLTEPVPGRDYDFYFLLHGLVQHALYHAGQIALLKKRKVAVGE